MTALIQEFTTTDTINKEIENHQAWLGRVSGLVAEKMLRARKRPYQYVLRAGENKEENVTDYYVTFMLPDYTVKHQPFTITTTEEGWHYENWSPGGPYTQASFDDVLHLIMHCHKDECAPLIQ